MSFSNLKKSGKTAFGALKSKIEADKRGASFGDDRIWAPEVDKAGNGFAVIRFLPQKDGEDMPFVRMYSHGFKVGAKWFIANCPTTIGGVCPVCEANSELWNTGLKTEQDIVRKRKRNMSYYSNILVISDKAHPENEGKVFLFRYGAKIFAKIQEAINPEFEDEVSMNPFDFWEGADFALKIRQVEGYKNYDKSAFQKPTPLFGGDDAKLEALWKSQYSLTELVSEDKFESAAVLKQKFDRAVGTPETKQHFTESDPSAHYDNDDGFYGKSASTESALSTDNTEDDLEMYSKLLGD